MSPGAEPNRVVGSGTILDTARLRVLLGGHFGVDPQSVHAYIIGERGDSQVPVWSAARIAGRSIAEFCRARGVAYDKAALEEMALRTRNAYYRIVGQKGATFYGIASGLVRVLRSILRLQQADWACKAEGEDPFNSRNGQILRCPYARKTRSKGVNQAEFSVKSCIFLQNSRHIAVNVRHSEGHFVRVSFVFIHILALIDLN